MNQNRHPRKVDGFTWGRVDALSATTYRLFWRSSNGRLRMLAWKFPAGTPRREIARELRRLRHNARVMRANDRSKAA